MKEGSLRGKLREKMEWFGSCPLQQAIRSGVPWCYVPPKRRKEKGTHTPGGCPATKAEAQFGHKNVNRLTHNRPHCRRPLTWILPKKVSVTKIKERSERAVPDWKRLRNIVIILELWILD